jgi:hypothetical protein
MKIINKIGIFVAALFLTLVGFSLMASPTLDMLRIGKQAGHEIIAHYLVSVEAPAPTARIHV